MAWNSPSGLPAHATRYPGNQWAAPPFSQHAGSDVYTQGPALAPFLNPYGGPQISSSDAVQCQPRLNPISIFVPDTQELAPMDWQAPPHSSGVEHQQPISHNHTEKIDSCDDFAIAIAIARPMTSGSSDEVNNNKWTGTLNLNGTRIPVRALMAEAGGDLYVHVLSSNAYQLEIYMHAEIYRLCQPN